MLQHWLKGVIVSLALLCSLSASAWAGITVGSNAFPSATVPGGTVIASTTIHNGNTTSEGATATLTINGPCADLFPAQVGAVALRLAANETRTATVSFRFPLRSCTGIYTLTVTVKNSSGQVIATHHTTITLEPAVP